MKKDFEIVLLQKWISFYYVLLSVQKGASFLKPPPLSRDNSGGSSNGKGGPRSALIVSKGTGGKSAVAAPYAGKGSRTLDALALEGTGKGGN